MHRWTITGLAVLLTLSLTPERSIARQSASVSDIRRVQEAITVAFGFLYALARDTAGASMGSWVLDTAATTDVPTSKNEWRIVATQLADTGDSLRREEMTGIAGASPRELAAAMVKMQELEAKISKAEADTSLDIHVSLDVAHEPLDENSELRDGVVAGASRSWLRPGYWTRVPDPDLGITVERWVAGELYVRYTSPTPRELQSITVHARGSDAMLERLVKDAHWHVLGNLMK